MKIHFRLSLLFCIFVSVIGVICLLELRHLEQKHTQKIERAQFVNDVVRTLEKGILLQSIAVEYRKQQGNFPSWKVITNIGSGVFRDMTPSLFHPPFYKAHSKARVDWMYRENLGEVTLKGDQIIVWEDGRHLDPSSFTFSISPAIPGFKLSEFGIVDGDFSEVQRQASELVRAFLKRN